MGLLDWLRRTRPPGPLDDWAWLEQAAKFHGLAEEAAARSGAGENVLVVAHFAETLVRAGTALAESGVPFELRPTWAARDSEALRSGPRTVLVALAGSLPTPNDHVMPGRPVAVLVAELHVLRVANERVVQFARALPSGSSARCFVSLDDAVLRRFVRGGVQRLMRALGQLGDERIESALLTRGLRKALAKVERSVFSDRACDSAEEWIEQNCRG